MKPAEFEEKDYEGPLYRELLCGSHRIATPGQVFENALGLDVLLEAGHPLFWEIFGHRDIPSGVRLGHFNLGWLWRRYGRHRTLPTFEVNLLIQAKRPERLRGVNSALAKHGIKGGYWRFKIREHQQILLERLEHTLGRRALIVYASPAFHNLDVLYDLTERETIVENSSFVRPSRMSGHHCWNYERAGSIGVATSRPEPVDDDGFFVQLEYALSKSEDVDPKLALDHLEKGIGIIVDESRGNPLADFYRRERERWFEEVESARRSRVLLQFLRISMFFDLLGVVWLVAGRDAEDPEKIADKLKK